MDGRIQPFLDTLPDHIRKVIEDEVSGRWFSDNPRYVSSYERPHTHWTYVDVPADVVEESRYEKVRHTLGLYGVEGKDIFLPKHWADQRVPFDGPPDLGPLPDEEDLLQVPKFSEITSNVARPGRILGYNSRTGSTTVVTRVEGEFVTILTKNRRCPGQGIEQVLPIRQVKPLWETLTEPDDTN